MGKTSATPSYCRGHRHLLILRTLRAGPLHGYAIAKRIKEASARGWTSKTALYRL